MEVLFPVFRNSSFDVGTRTKILIIRVLCFMNPEVELAVEQINGFVNRICHDHISTIYIRY